MQSYCSVYHCPSDTVKYTLRQTRSGRVVNEAVDLSCKIVSIGGFGYARKLYADCIKILPHREGIRRYNFHL